MCWNAEVSLTTFTVGFASIIFSYFNGYPFTELLFYSSVTLMQLIEFFIWTYYDNQRLNSLFTILGALLIGIQPIASLSMLYKTHKKLMIYMMLFYVIMIISNVKKFSLKDYYSYRGDNGHLVWSWTKKDRLNKLSLAVYFICLLLAPLILGYYDLFSFGVITLIISLYTFYKYDTWGSMWCWIVNIWIIYILVKQVFIEGMLP
jgi:hypothetical protein